MKTDACANYTENETDNLKVVSGSPVAQCLESGHIPARAL